MIRTICFHARLKLHHLRHWIPTDAASAAVVVRRRSLPESARRRRHDVYLQLGVSLSETQHHLGSSPAATAGAGFCGSCTPSPTEMMRRRDQQNGAYRPEAVLIVPRRHWHWCLLNELITPMLCLHGCLLTDVSVTDTDKKLSCRKQTARRFTSANILLSHSRSLKVILNDTVE